MSDNINDGGPAFATSVTETRVTKREEGGDVVLANYGSHPGMTLRDYFAAAALQGLLADGHGNAWCNDTCSAKAFKLADAMLKAKEAKP